MSGCPTAELKRVMAQVASRDWTSRKRAPFSMYVDERRCRVIVNIVKISPSERRRLRAIDRRIVIELVSGPIERISQPQEH